VSSNRLKSAIERIRAELSEQLHQSCYNFNDENVMKTSRKLDRLINLFYRPKQKKPLR
jgi:hypothetical protein